uniref:MSP domain-containing protein n=1 Tax=Aegilops tauschii TaxID=37682 RepID=M8B5T8_AEGTA
MSSTLLRVCPSELKIPCEDDEPEEVLGAPHLRHSAAPELLQRHSAGHGVGLVTMQAPRDMQLDHHCKDKFLVQSAVARDGATMRDLVPELFTRAPGRLIEEFKLRVVYIAANPPSPVPEEAEEEDASPRSEVTMGYEAKVSSAFDAASRCMDNSGAKPSCTKGASVVPTLVGEKVSTREENQKRLQQNMMVFSYGTSNTY